MSLLAARRACSPRRASPRSSRSGSPVAFDASADERDTRGFISMTSSRPSVGLHGELHVGAARLDADLAQHGDGRIAHALVFLVRQRLRRRDRDRVARVHAHRIEVLDRADDDAVVVAVAHHLHLVLFPADHRLFEQHFARRRGVEAARHDGPRTPRGCTRCRRRVPPSVNDGRIIDREPTSSCTRPALPRACARCGGVGVSRPISLHGVAEQLAVLGHVDRFARRGDQLDIVLLQHAFAHQVERAC